jgi:nitrogen regulatory protein P-II 2
MDTHAKKLLVIIGEAALEKQLVADARRLGAHGYTISAVRGGGERGEREARWEADRSIELQVVCGAEVATRIAEHVLQTYAPHYAVALYLSDVQVFRAQKY